MDATNNLIKLCFIVLIFSLTSCSQNKNNNFNVDDRYEGFNRKVYSFNETIDHLMLKPTAQAYKLVTPDPIEKGISNFFENVDDVGNAINNVLQFKFADALNDTERVIFNTTFGFLGFVDVATSAGLEKHNEDFGQTLAKWGVESGPYIVLPLLGPSTVRDSIATVSVDRFTDPLNYSEDSIQHTLTNVIVLRANLLTEEEVLSNLSEDRYGALRDAWLQRRASLLNDGKIDEQADSDLIDELESLEAE